MKLEYSANKTEVITTLEQGENFSGTEGPIELTVPVDPQNRHFAAIQRHKLTIPYGGPVPVEPLDPFDIVL